MPSEVAILAARLLDERELKAASGLAAVLSDDESVDELLTGSMIEKILPAYWEIKDGRPEEVDPSPIFRALYYLHGYSNLANFASFTRDFVEMASAHLEACMQWLTPFPSEEWSGGEDFGRLVVELREAGVIPASLAGDLESFDRVANAGRKPPDSEPGSQSPPGGRAFSIEDAALLLMITRKLSIQLFEALNSNGVKIEHPWPPLSA